MNALTDEELSQEIKRRSDLLLVKRQSEAAAVISEKRMRLLEELDELDGHMDYWTATTSNSSSSATSSSLAASSSLATSSSSATSSSLAAFSSSATSSSSVTSSSSASLSSSLTTSSSVSAPSSNSLEINPEAPKAKNSMFTYYNKAVIDVEAVNERRANEAKINSMSRESNLHRDRKGKVGSQNKTKDVRTCTLSQFTSLQRKLLRNDDVILITYDTAERRIFCSACPCYVRDDNIEAHIKCEKHLAAAAAAVEANLHQTRLENAITISTTLSNCIPGKTHLFRCELTRNLLTAAIPIYKADELRPLIQKWMKIELTHSSNLLREYLPIIKVKLLLSCDELFMAETDSFMRVDLKYKNFMSIAIAG